MVECPACGQTQSGWVPLCPVCRREIPPPLLIGEILLEINAITRDQLQKGLESQKMRMSDRLLRDGLIPPEKLAEVEREGRRTIGEILLQTGVLDSEKLAVGLALQQKRRAQVEARLRELGDGLEKIPLPALEVVRKFNRARDWLSLVGHFGESLKSLTLSQGVAVMVHGGARVLTRAVGGGAENRASEALELVFDSGLRPEERRYLLQNLHEEFLSPRQEAGLGFSLINGRDKLSPSARVFLDGFPHPPEKFLFTGFQAERFGIRGSLLFWGRESGDYGVRDLKIIRLICDEFHNALETLSLFDPRRLAALSGSDGAPSLRAMVENIREIEEEKGYNIPSTCTYCGSGCGILMKAEGGKIVGVKGDPEDPFTNGLLCVKGATLHQTVYEGRIERPMIRRNIQGEWYKKGFLQEATWDDAYDLFVRKLRHTIDHHGPDSFQVYSTGMITNEENYLLNKLVKGFLKTNNVDANSRLCVASAAGGYYSAYGKDGTPASFDDFKYAEAIFIWGCNMKETFPVPYLVMRANLQPGCKIVCLDPRTTPTAREADLHVPLKLGSDIALLNGIARWIIEKGRADLGFIEKWTHGFDEFRRRVEPYTPAWVETLTGISPTVLERLAELWMAGPALSVWARGVDQSIVGLWKNHSIHNLHLISGQIGKRGAGPLSMVGQCNAMGERDMGTLADKLPGHRSVLNGEDRRAMEEFWGIPSGSIPARVGFTAMDIPRAILGHAHFTQKGWNPWDDRLPLPPGFDTADVPPRRPQEFYAKDSIRFLWIIGTNPKVSLPDYHGLAEKCFQDVEFLVVSEPYKNAKTIQHADIVFPAASHLERGGTMTNSEREINILQPGAEPLGESRPDWRMIVDIAHRLGWEQQFNFKSPEEVFRELQKATKGTECDYSGIRNYRQIIRHRGIKWPVADGFTASRRGTERKFMGQDGRREGFSTPDGKARILFRDHNKFPADPQRMTFDCLSEEFPLWLITGRLYALWQTHTRTDKVRAIVARNPGPFLEIHPTDATRFAIAEGDMVKLQSSRGMSGKIPARLTDNVPPGILFAPFHFQNALINNLTGSAYCAESREPELKIAAVKLLPLVGLDAVKRQDRSTFSTRTSIGGQDLINDSYSLDFLGTGKEGNESGKPG